MAKMFLMTGKLSRLLVLSLTVILFQCDITDSHNILSLLPHFGYSHFKVFYPILNALAENGHNVTVITYNKNPKPHANYHELLLTGSDTINVFTPEVFPTTRSLPELFIEYFILHEEGQKSCKMFFERIHVKNVLKWHQQNPYDLIITEYFNTDCYLALPELMNVSIVGLSSCALMPYFYERIRLPDHPSYVQSEFIGFGKELNWWERLVNFIQSQTLPFLYNYYTNYHDNKMIKKYLDVDMDVRKIAKERTSLIFVNQHYTLSGTQPLTPQLIQMGGIHITEKDINTTLPSEIINFLKVPAAQQILFISWGSMLRGSALPKSTFNAIVNVVERLKLKVIWKWENDEKPIDNENFLFVKWAPQLALLCHPKINYFWGHGGLLGTTEAVYCGKPLIVTPIYGDQFLNGHAIQNREIGVILNYKNIDEHNLYKAIEEIMEKSYKIRAKVISNIFRDREVSPLNTTLWWIEHVLKHGKVANDVLKSRAVSLNWFIYHSFDSITLLLIGVIFILWVWRKILYFLLKKCATTKKQKLKLT